MALVRAVDGVCVPGAKPGRQEHRSAGQGEALSTDERSRAKRFEEIFATHLDAAYNYAHWLTRDARNAEDVVQEACLRAFKFLDSFRGDREDSPRHGDVAVVARAQTVAAVFAASTAGVLTWIAPKAAAACTPISTRSSICRASWRSTSTSPPARRARRSSRSNPRCRRVSPNTPRITKPPRGWPRGFAATSLGRGRKSPPRTSVGASRALPRRRTPP